MNGPSIYTLAYMYTVLIIFNQYVPELRRYGDIRVVPNSFCIENGGKSCSSKKSATLAITFSEIRSTLKPLTETQGPGFELKDKHSY